MPRYLIYSKERGRYEFSDSPTVPLITSGVGLQRVLDATNPRTRTRSPLAGEHVSLERYMQLLASVPTSSPSTEEDVVWDDTPYVLPSSGNIVIENRNLRNLDPTRFLLDLPNGGSGRSVIIRNCRLWSRGKYDRGIINAPGTRLTIQNCQIKVLPPTVAGHGHARLLQCEDPRHLVFEDNTVFCTGKGLFFLGYAPSGQKKYNGNLAAGEGIFIRRNKFYNVDGRISNGSGGFLRSNWSTQNQTWFVNGVNWMADKTGIIRAFEIANAAQFNQLPLTHLIYEDNEVLNDLGCTAEDLFSGFYGFGSPAGYPSYIQRNLIHNTGGPDFTYIAGVSTVYNGGRRVPGGDGPQLLDSTGPYNAGTCLLIGDSHRTDDWECNAANIIIQDNEGFGHRAMFGQHSGHDIQWLRNTTYDTDRHFSGIPYESSRPGAFYEFGDGSGGATAPKDDGTTAQITMSTTFNNNVLAKGTTNGTLSVPSIITSRPGGSASGNTTIPAPLDGGAQIIRDWRARQVAAGRSIGSTLPIPAGETVPF